MSPRSGNRRRRPARGRLRAALLRVALLAATLGFVLGSLEIGLRLFWGGFYVKIQRGYAQPHPQRGWANRPDIQVPYGEPEFATTVTHNHFGYRGHAIERERTPGRVRVLALGDSFTYGVGVEDDQTFSAVLESLEARLEVINTGVNGYGTGQELVLLRSEGLDLQPDVVIVAFFWNDVANSYTNRVVRFALVGDELHYQPVPLPEVAAAPARIPTELHEGRRAWLRYSYAYRFLSDRAKLLSYWSKYALGLPLEDTDFVSDAQREDAWKLELALLREIDRTAREHGAHTLLLMIPDQVQVQPDVHVTGLQPADYQVQERLRAFADAAGIAVVDPLSALRAAYQASGQPLYYLRDRHLRASGQAIVAHEILARLRELGWLEPAAGGAPADATPAGR